MYTTRPAEFAYHRPSSLDEAVALLAELAEQADGFLDARCPVVGERGRPARVHQARACSIARHTRSGVSGMSM